MKKQFTLICAILLTAIVVAGFQKEPEFKLKLTANEINIVLDGLQELPHKKSAGVIQKIIGQASDSTFQKMK